LIVSSVFHGLLLVFALVGFSAPNTLDRPRPVQVEIISPGNLGGVSAGKPDQQPEAAKQIPPPEKHAEVTPTASDGRPSETVAKKQAALPPPKPKAEPPAEPPKAVEKKPEPRPEPAPQAEKKPAPPPVSAKHADAPRPREEKSAPPQREQREPKRRPPPRKDDRIADLLERPTHAARGESDFDANRIAALLNRDPTAGERPQQDGPRRAWRRPSTLEEQASGAAPDAPRREAYGAPEGRDQRMGGDDIAAFRAQISRCWSPPVGGLGGDAIIVKLRIMLDEDGTLTRPPELANDFNSPFFRPAADSAIRAVLQCQPYRLPPEKFSQWRDMLLTFDPSRMYGG
jgi:hypothetical protein